MDLRRWHYRLPRAVWLPFASFFHTDAVCCLIFDVRRFYRRLESCGWISPIDGWKSSHCTLELRLNLDPRKWMLLDNHVYYDGAHCLYNFGPVSFAQDWFPCDRCSEEGK